jgi:hypothetical protein
MMCAVVDANESEGASSASSNGDGVLANLPRTRPQRSTARRAAARTRTAAAKRPPKARTAKAATPKGSNRPGTVTKPSKPPTTEKRKRRAPTAKRPSISLEDPAPRQGFESDGESATASVQPPGGPELIVTAAEIVGELAKAGLSTSERLVKDVISRLPLS